ncbi:MAG: hypothetical protein ACRD0C_17545 [Acidimicrobiia bacterium]
MACHPEHSESLLMPLWGRGSPGRHSFGGGAVVVVLDDGGTVDVVVLVDSGGRVVVVDVGRGEVPGEVCDVVPVVDVMCVVVGERSPGPTGGWLSVEIVGGAPPVVGPAVAVVVDDCPTGDPVAEVLV